MHYLLVCCFFPRQKMFIFCSLLSVMEAHCNIGVPTVHWGCTPEKCNASVSTNSKAIFPFRVNVTGCRCMWGLQIHRDNTCVVENGHAMTGFSGLSSGEGTGLAAAHFSDQAMTLWKKELSCFLHETDCPISIYYYGHSCILLHFHCANHLPQNNRDQLKQSAMKNWKLGGYYND